MRCTCAAPSKTCSPELVANLKALGVTPIVTSQVVRAVYDGPSGKTCKAIIALFEQEADHDIVADGVDEQRTEKHRRKKKR